MKTNINDSQFYMWRTVFALAHADHILKDEEIRYMAEILEDIPFTHEQREILSKDIQEPQGIVNMFEGICNPNDQARFFKFAHEMVWIDKEYVKEERQIMLKLEQSRIIWADIDNMVGSVDLELDENHTPNFPEKIKKPQAKNIIQSFRAQFFQNTE